MKKKLVFLAGFIVCMCAVIALFSLINSKQNDPVNQTSQSGGPDSEKIKIISDESFFVSTGKDSDGITIALKNEIREPFILMVPETFQKEKVGSFDGITSSEFVVEIQLPDGVKCVDISSCAHLKKIHFGKIGSNEIVKNDDGSINIGSHPPFSMIEDCPELQEITFSDNQGYTNLISWVGLPELKEISFPEKLLGISGCFLNNCGITKVKLTDSLISIDSSFLTAPSLTYAYCGENLESISFSFNFCQSLQYVVIPSKTTKISQSFLQCENLTLVVEKDSAAEKYAEDNDIKYIYISDFDYDILDNLKEIPAETGDMTESSFDLQDGVYTEEEVQAAIHVSSEEYFREVKGSFGDDYELVIQYIGKINEPFVLEIPDTFEGKPVDAFFEILNNPYVCEIIFPEEVESCGSFMNCKNLRSVTYGKKPGSITNCQMFTKLDCSKCTSSDCPAISDCPGFEYFDVPVSVEILGGLNNCGIKTLILHEGLQEIWMCAAQCHELEEVIIPEGVTRIMDSFYNCNNLKRVYIPKSVNEIMDSFTNCPNLELVVEKYSAAEQYAKNCSIPYTYPEDDN